MAIFSKLFSGFLSFIMMILNIFGIGAEKTPEFVLGENVNSNVAQVLEIYNNAVIETDKDAPAVTTTLSVEELFLSGAASGTSIMIKPALNDMLAEESYKESNIPGEGKLAENDVVSAKSSSENGKTTVIIEVKDQTNDAYGNSKDGESVSNAIGTLGDVATYIEEAGILTGVENMEIIYTDCTIACIIDESTGEIIRGEWYYNLTLDMDGVFIAIGESPIEMSGASVTIGFKSEL